MGEDYNTAKLLLVFIQKCYLKSFFDNNVNCKQCMLHLFVILTSFLEPLVPKYSIIGMFSLQQFSSYDSYQYCFQIKYHHNSCQNAMIFFLTTIDIVLFGGREMEIIYLFKVSINKNM